MTKEYVVTLKNFEDLDVFYEDMETDGGSVTIPERTVECSLRRTISRNTHYLLSDEEAEELRNDTRVLAVELLPKELGLKPTPFWSQSGNFEKSSTVDTNDKNWGLYRCVNGSALSNWGTNGSFTQTTQSISTTSSGKNVDVVIVDAHINPNHPEFAINSDGTGGSRVNQLNWFQYSSAIGVSTTGVYDYSNISSNHGTHVAGTAAGNTQGWARDATIYNMEFDYVGSNSPAGDWALLIFDYIRYWHKNKSVNSQTGKRNPTITNHSWGYSVPSVSRSTITSLNYRGVTTSVSNPSNSVLNSNGIPSQNPSNLIDVPYRYAALDADIQDAINDGVIVISSAGNSYWVQDISTGQDYNNYLSSSLYGQLYHSRGSSPAGATGVISVGSIGVTTEEYKSLFSNYGAGVNVYAPGSNVISSVYDTSAASEFGITLVNDPRSSSYKLGSISGTSMSSPQVCGIIALLAEHDQNIKQNDVLEYIAASSKTGQVGSTGGGAGDYTSLGTNSNNKFLYYVKQRLDSGLLQPKANLKTRKTNGMLYPRVNIQKTKN